MASFEARHESWPLEKPFAISRGTKTAADVVVCEITMDEGVSGRGECVPYARYGESVEGVIEDIESRALDIAKHPDRKGLLSSMPAGAARNAIDCALWDLQAKLNNRRAWDIAGMVEPPAPAVTATTIGIGTPDEMAAAAAALTDAKLLKIKLNAEHVVTRVSAVREAAPDARLIVDPNEGWDIAVTRDVAQPLAELGIGHSDDGGLVDVGPIGK